jgi:hypothetical protein
MRWRVPLLALVVAVCGDLPPNPLQSLPDIEMTALVGLHQSTNGRDWTQSWQAWAPLGNLELHPCDWYGVTCATFPDGPHVVELSLVGNNLVGTLSDTLGWLQKAYRVDLSSNALVGQSRSRIVVHVGAGWDLAVPYAALSGAGNLYTLAR